MRRKCTLVTPARAFGRFYDDFMGLTRINLGLAMPMLKDLDKLAAKYGFDRTNAIRYCIRTTCDSELKPQEETQRNPKKPA
jgi:hypothetical protein